MRQPWLAALLLLAALPAQAASPASFGYTERSKVATRVFVTSETRTLTGFEGSLPVRVMGGQNPQYSIDGAAFTATLGSITSGQKLTVRHLSSSSPGTRSQTTVTVGDFNTPFASITGEADRTPNAFAFASKGNVAPGAAVESASVTPAGYNTPVAVSVSSNGQYRIGSGAYTSAAGTLQPGQSLSLRHTANAQKQQYTVSSINVGGVSASFTTRTQGAINENLPPDADGDGVADASDQCPGSAAGSSVEPNGCAGAAPLFTLQVNRSGDGQVTSSPVGIDCGSDCSEGYALNTSVTLNVVEVAGSRFSGWSGACTGTGACTVTMSANQTVGASFTAIPRHALTVSKAGAGSGTVSSTPAGIDCGSDCSESFEENTLVSLTAQPVAGSVFTAWSGACTGAAGCEVTMSTAKAITATFAVATVTSAIDFATDSRTADGGDPGSNLNPILSSARPNGDATPVPNANADGKTFISANVFVPAYTTGQTFPVVLHSHGWGGAKEGTPRGTGLPTVLANEGYIVVSFSERGWGDTEGEIRIMDPAYESQDAKAVIDWLVAEAAAGRLPVKMDGPGDPRIGTYGGSYGGGFQLNLAAEDPRVDALAPDITWHDLRYSLIPNGLVKAGWGNLLCAVGQARPNRDEFLIKACDALPGASSSVRTKEGIETVVTGFHDFVFRNGMVYYKETGASPVAGSGYARRMPPVLLTQGMRDNLFNGLEAAHNYKFLSSISPDVRLFTHQSGHLNPTVSQASGPQTCGPINLIGNAQAVTRAWFKRYLKDDLTALNGLPRVCISLEANKAVVLDTIPEGGVSYTAGLSGISITTQTAPPPTNAMFKSLATISTAGQILAGIPRFNGVTVKCPIPAPGVCPPVTVAAEPIALVGIGLKRGAAITLIDEQLTPIRTMGSPHTRVELPMIGEALNVGDEIGLLFYTVQGQYKVEAASSGGNAVPAAGPNDQYSISIGSVELPVFTPVAGSLR